MRVNIFGSSQHLTVPSTDASPFSALLQLRLNRKFNSEKSLGSPDQFKKIVMKRMSTIIKKSMKETNILKSQQTKKLTDQTYFKLKIDDAQSPIGVLNYTFPTLHPHLERLGLKINVPETVYNYNDEQYLMQTNEKGVLTTK